MLCTKLSGTSGMILTLSSILLGPGFWGYQTGVALLQAGILALGLELFFKLGSSQSRTMESMYLLDDMEGFFERIKSA